ncbi:MAG: hypothetical protein ACYC7E_16590 [Armatimonadota bacterium]
MLHRLLISAAITALTLGAGLASTTVYQFRMNTRPEPPPTYQYPPTQPYGQPPESVTAGPDSWWIVNQPYVPYFGYSNPPITQGYYPPYAFPGYGPGGAPGYYDQHGRFVPSLPLVTPPRYVPTLRAHPVSPPPLRIRRLPGGGYRYERDPHFRLYYTPRGPDYSTSGSTVYQTPPYPPYYYPYPPYPY